MLSGNSSSLSFLFRDSNSLYHTKAINTILFYEDLLFYTGARDSIIKLWSIDPIASTLNLSSNYEKHFNWINDLSIAKKQNILFSCSNDQLICKWDTSIHSFLGTIPNSHTDYITSIKYNDINNCLYSAGLDGNLFELSQSREGSQVVICNDKNESIYSMDVSNDGNVVLVSKYNHSLMLYDIRTKTSDMKQAQCQLRGHKDIIRNVALSPTGEHAISVSSDKTIKLWDISRAKIIQSFDFHTDSIMSLYVNSSFTKVITGSKNGEICLIDLKQLVYTKMDQLPGSVLSIAMNPSESRIIMSSSDNKLYTYQIKKDKCRHKKSKKDKEKDKENETGKEAEENKDNHNHNLTASIPIQQEEGRESILIAKDEIISYTLMNNKIYVIMEYNDKSTAIFNLVKMKQIARMTNISYTDLIDKLKEIDKTTLRTWCTLDIKLGSLMMTLTEETCNSNTMNFDIDFIEKILDKKFVINSETKFLLNEEDNTNNTTHSIKGKTGENFNKSAIYNGNNNNNRALLSQTPAAARLKGSFNMNSNKPFEENNSISNISCGRYVLNKILLFYFEHYLNKAIRQMFIVEDMNKFKKYYHINQNEECNHIPESSIYLIIINKDRKMIEQLYLNSNLKESMINFPSFCITHEINQIYSQLFYYMSNDLPQGNFYILIDSTNFKIPFNEKKKEKVETANLAYNVLASKLISFICKSLNQHELQEHINKDLKNQKRLTQEEKDYIQKKYLSNTTLFLGITLNDYPIRTNNNIYLKTIKEFLQLKKDEFKVVLKYNSISELIERKEIQLNHLK